MIHALDGPVMPYAWGSRSELPRLLGRVPSGQPQAELWIGAHPGGPARLVPPVGDADTLGTLIEQDPARHLGSALASAYGRLPYLLKILAIEQPLSLQAHPSLEQARRGFLREDALGIEPESTRRNYRDDNHKPELLYALEPVDALCGFRSHDDALAQLGAFGLERPESPLREAVRAFRLDAGPRSYERMFRSLFELDRPALEAALAVVRRSAQAHAPDSGLPEPPDFSRLADWVLRLWDVYGSDPGLLAVLLLRLVRLEPGEALFLPAGRLHAYLSGLGVEVMAASDNVLRGGLTPKHVDVDELCHVLDFRPTEPDLLPGVPAEADARARVFRAAASEFELWMIDLPGDAVPLEILSPSLLVVLSGHIDIAQAGQRLGFDRGGQAFCSWSVEPTLLRGKGRLAVASVPRA